MWFFHPHTWTDYCLKGIVWDRRWIAPSIGIFSPHMLIFFLRNAFLIIKLSNLPSFRAIHIWKINCCIFLTFLLVFVSHFTQVQECFDMWYFGNRFLIGATFIWDIIHNHYPFVINTCDVMTDALCNWSS